MKTHKIATVWPLLLFFVFLNMWAADHQNQQKPMDEWEALQISLKGARSIRPKNGFVPDESTAIQIAEATVKAQYGEKEKKRFRTNNRSVLGYTVKSGS
jgi:hypothetical protein